MTNDKIYKMPFAKLYPMLIAKAEKKGHTRAEVDEKEQPFSWLLWFCQS